MKHVKRYFILMLLMALAIFLKLNKADDKYASIEYFRGAALNQEVLYPLMAENINSTENIAANINGEVIENTQDGVILNYSLKPMVSIEFINDRLYASAIRYDESGLWILRGDSVYTLKVGQKEGSCDGQMVMLAEAPTAHNNTLYVGLQDICTFFDYDYNYDDTPGARMVAINCGAAGGLPVRFDMRTFSRNATVRDQGKTSDCWAYAAIEAVETAITPFDNTLLDVNHVINGSSFGVGNSVNGDYTMALAYMLAWQGPVSSEDEEVVYHLSEAHFYDSSDVEAIKWSVYRYGGVTTSIYANLSPVESKTNNFYNKQTKSYCYFGEAKPNHDVVIIGWDDNYAKENFSVKVPDNGAFICLNSWGKSFGEDGVFYVSYYDANIGNQSVSYAKLDNIHKYDHIYQSDLLGWVGQMGYSAQKCYGANIFKATSDQLVKACGFYALGKNTSYEIYAVKNYKDVGSLSNRTLVARGTLKDAGFFTIDFDNPVDVVEGEEFAIIAGISTPGMNRPMAIEYDANELSAAVDLTDGEGYTSKNGIDWENLLEEAGANLCIKAYTVDKR